ncbi:MAG: potassium-transporting ATPase subunit KdpA [Bacillota bacterium]
MVGKCALTVLLFTVALTALAVPLGSYLARVFTGKRTLLSPLLRPVEGFIYRITAIHPFGEMSWRKYLIVLLVFNFWGLCLGYLLLRLQGVLPFNPTHRPGLPGPLAFNVIASFVTNTNWQAYAGETTMSCFSQMVVLAVQNFLSAATGLAAAMALIRAFAASEKETIGNFWVDLVRGLLYVLIPLSIILAVFLVSQGVVQTLEPPAIVKTLEGFVQEIARGPVASQEAIKLLGTNGGGYFNANSAHPFENPNGLTNFTAMLSILLIPAALPHTFGRLIKNPRQGWLIYAVMLSLFAAGAFTCAWIEAHGNPLFARLHFSPGPNLEGKEVRFGAVGAALFAVVTTAASCGAVNCLHDSLLPLGGLVPLANILTGEVIFGGVGSGFYGMMAYALLTVFLAGLMVGRTPEFLGKKVEGRDVRYALAVLLVPSVLVLVFGALGAILPAGRAGITAAGPHGLTQVLYAFASAANNNGSAFGGLGANLPFYLWTTAACMLLGRFFPLAATLALAGSLAAKRYVAPGPGTFPTTGVTFALLLSAVIVIVGALTFFPALTLGPVLEHLLLAQGRLF